MVEKIILKESMKNLPDWFTQNVSKEILDVLNRKGFDLHNCEFTPISKSSNRAFEWNSGDAIVFYFKYEPPWDNTETEYYVALWIDGKLYGDFYVERHYGKKSRRDLLDEADKVAVIRKYVDSNVKDTSKEKYQDPRYFNNAGYGSQKDYYAGQTKYDDGTWSDPSYEGRDKSGYEIPTPEYWQQRAFVEFGLDKYNKQLDDYYNQIVSAKERLYSSIDNVFDVSRYSADYNGYAVRAFDTFESVCIAYNFLLEALDKAQGSIDWVEKFGGSRKDVDVKGNTNKLKSNIAKLDEELEKLNEYLDKM